MQFEHGELSELTESVKSEGNPRLILAPATIPASALIPQAWRTLLLQKDAHLRAADTLWSDAESLLPGVVSTIDDKLQGIGLLITDTKRASLIYIFLRAGEIVARRGYPPVQALPAVANRLSIDLSPIAKVHDGWVDFFSNDTGLLPTEEWQVLGRTDSGPSKGFLEVFTTGGNGMGFDLSESPATSYIIWSDEDVEPVGDFWERLDSWISEDLEQLESNATP